MIPGFAFGHKNYRKSKAFKIILFYLLVCHVILIAQMKLSIPILKPFPMMELMSVVVCYFLIRFGVLASLFRGRHSLLYNMVTIMFAYQLFSVIMYFQPGNTYSVNSYIYGVHYCVLPILLFYLVQFIRRDEERVLLKRILLLNLILCIIGLFVYILRPEFYTDYLMRLFAQTSIVDEWQLYGRLQSYLGSTSVGNVAAISFLLTIYVVNNPYTKFFYLIVFAVTVLLTQQRGSIIILGFSTLVSIVKFVAYTSIIRKSIFGTVVCLICIFVYNQEKVLFSKELRESFTYMVHRVSTQTNPINLYKERAEGYTKAGLLISEYPMGVGLGATLSASDQATGSGLGQVVDANFARILADTCIIGFVLFLLVLFLALKKAVRRTAFGMYAMVICFYSFQALGTNIFDSFLCIHLFWLYLGILNKQA